MIAKYENLSLEQYLNMFYDIVNSMQLNEEYKTTKLERKLLVLFTMLPDKYKYQRFSSLAKKKIRADVKANENWNLTTQNLNGKLYSLIDKGILRKDADGVIYLKPFIEKAVNNIKESYENKTKCDFTFRFQP